MAFNLRLTDDYRCGGDPKRDAYERSRMAGEARNRESVRKAVNWLACLFALVVCGAMANALGQG